MTLLTRSRAAWAYARPRLRHYDLAIFPFGFLLGQTSALFNFTTAVQVIAIGFPCVIVSIGLMVFVAATSPHDVEKCERCADLRPKRKAEFNKLTLRQAWHRMRWQHYQLYICLAAITVIYFGGLGTYYLISHDRRIQVAYILISVVLFAWGDSWQIYHRQFTWVCPWCERRRGRMFLRMAFRRARRKIDEKVAEPPREPEDETEGSDSDGTESGEDEAAKPRRRWLPRPARPATA